MFADLLLQSRNALRGYEMNEMNELRALRSCLNPDVVSRFA